MGKYEGTRMFHKVTRTWNPIIGCKHLCSYCWAWRLAEDRLSKMLDKYKYGFRPMFCERELKAKFKPNELVFVADMGDMFGEWVPKSWILKVLSTIKRFPRTTFLLLTKNPKRYLEDGIFDELSKMSNVILGVTIETNDDLIYTIEVRQNVRPPLPSERISTMIKLKDLLPNARTMISIEPIIKFKSGFAEEVYAIKPEFVYIGYDNYDNRLPEPKLKDTVKLISKLEGYGITVYRKTIRKAWYEH